MNWIFGGVFLFLAMLLFGLYYYISIYQLHELGKQLSANKEALKRFNREETFILQDGLQDLVFRYSEGMSAVQSVFSARKEVFSGDLAGETLLPVMILYMPDFFETLQSLLSKKVVLSNISIGQRGDILFVVQTTSYAEAGKQMAALRFGLNEKKKRLFREENENDALISGLRVDEKLEEKSIPALLVDFEISNVTRQLNVGAEDLVSLFRDMPFNYSFLVRASINPEYFRYLSELEDERLSQVEENLPQEGSGSLDEQTEFF